MSLLDRRNVKKTKVIINCEEDLKLKFKDICTENGLTMTDVLLYTMEKIIEKGELDSVDYKS
ncbi:TPA: type II toxin-antitoxin system RelB/DinJ family antitoxin [Vibrio parahaemolyticus]|nr:type II toxin-antitoxin system RelB/DinJ family antitoxin [Vibrio parahaemolyticus]